MKSFKPWLLIILIFLAGNVTGVVATRIVVRRIIARVAAHPELVREKIERDLDRKLDLDSDQQQKVHDILVDAGGQIRGLRQQFSPRFTGILSNAETQISATLTPDQRDRFDKYLEKNRRFLRPSL